MPLNLPLCLVLLPGFSAGTSPWECVDPINRNHRDLVTLHLLHLLHIYIYIYTHVYIVIYSLIIYIYNIELYIYICIYTRICIYIDCATKLILRFNFFGCVVFVLTTQPKMCQVVIQTVMLNMYEHFFGNPSRRVETLFPKDSS